MPAKERPATGQERASNRLNLRSTMANEGRRSASPGRLLMRFLERSRPAAGR
jgi:hypothetical protein